MPVRKPQSGPWCGVAVASGDSAAAPAYAVCAKSIMRMSTRSSHSSRTSRSPRSPRSPRAAPAGLQRVHRGRFPLASGGTSTSRSPRHDSLLVDEYAIQLSAESGLGGCRRGECPPSPSSYPPIVSSECGRKGSRPSLEISSCSVDMSKCPGDGASSAELLDASASYSVATASSSTTAAATSPSYTISKEL